MDNVVIVGGGLAGFRFAQSLREAGYADRLTVVCDEVHQPYDRPPLSKQLLAGDYTEEQCALPGEVADVTWLLGRRAASLDRGRSVVVLDNGDEVEYDGLLIATGRRAREWPGDLPAEGVHTMRNLSDTAAFRASIGEQAKVVIIGAGFIGCEVAATLRKEDVDVTVVDVSPYPMPAMGPEIGAKAVAIHESHGVKFRLGAGVAAVEGDDRVTGVRLEDGELLPATVVLVAVGSIPNSEWLAGSGLALDRGVVACDATCSVLDQAGNVVPEIMAAGDVAAWPHHHGEGAVCIEHWSNARDMADLAAKNLLVDPADRSPMASLASVPTFWSDQYNVKIKSAGYLRAADGWTVVSEQDGEKPSLLAEGHRGDELVAAVAFNMNRSIIKYHRELAVHEPV